MSHPTPWLAALFAAILFVTPSAAQDGDYPDDYDDGEYYEDDGGPYEDDGGPYDDEGGPYDDGGPYGDHPGAYDDDNARFGLHIGPDSFGLYFDQDDYDRYGRGKPRFGLQFDGFGGGIFFDLDGGNRRYQRGHWYCPRSHCRGRGHWGRGFGRGRPGVGRHSRYGCHPVFKRGFRHGREVLIRALMCYDRDGYAYIEPGSRRVVRRY